MNDARSERDLLGAKAVRVPASVPPLVMVAHERRDRVGPRDLVHDERAHAGMLAQQLQLVVAQRAFRVQLVVVQLTDADVVEDAGHRDLLDLHRRESQPRREFPRHASHVE